MTYKTNLSFALLLALAPAGEAAAVGTNAEATPTAASVPSVVSSDCSQGFLSRLGAAYHEDAQPADPKAPAPARRAINAPLDSPPFHNGEWQLGGVAAPIGVPAAYGQYPLQKALACTKLGDWMKRNHIEVNGWINPSGTRPTTTTTMCRCT
jgi:hypothetical protein